MDFSKKSTRGPSRDKMADILQMMFCKAFFWMISFGSWLKLLQNFFPDDPISEKPASNREQANIWIWGRAIFCWFFAFFLVFKHYPSFTYHISSHLMILWITFSYYALCSVKLFTDGIDVFALNFYKHDRYTWTCIERLCPLWYFAIECHCQQ